MMYLSNYRLVMLAMVFIFLGSFAIAQDDLKFGSKVLPHDIDESRALSPFYVGPELAFVDLNNNGLLEPGDPLNGDPVYIHIDPTASTVSENDVRLTSFGIFPAGSQVGATDPDHGKPLRKFGFAGYPAAELRYFDVDGDRVYSLDDPVYLDLNPGTVRAGDIRITSYNGYPAGSRVRDSDGDSDKLTSVLPGMFCFYNTYGDINNGGWGVFGQGDVVYLDTQYPFHSVTVNDIRMSGGI